MKADFLNNLNRGHSPRLLKRVFGSICMLWIAVAIGQQTPAPAQVQPITIEGATAHLGNGKIIENSLIMFADGKLTFVGDAKMKIARTGKVIDAKGQHVYPGLIAPAKPLGLVEIDAVRATDDQDEIGGILPHIRSLIAYNAESQVVESMRPNGVLLAQITPQGGRISGTSSIVQFDAWNWEDAAVKTDDGIHLNWPNTFRRGRWWLGEPRGFQPNKDYQKDVKEVATFMANAKAYDNDTAKEVNLAYAAMQGLFSGAQKLYIYAHGEKEIIDAITQAKAAGVAKIVLVGGYQAHKVASFLKEHNIPVLVRYSHTLPFFEDDDYDFTYKLPKLLSEAGLLVALQNTDDSNFATRNLPFYAGHVAAQGLDKEKALELITGNTAKILGIDDTYGTLEVGKSATLFISKGDALDMVGNQLSKAFIDGRDISLETHQTTLYKRYMGKYDGK
ncbi:Putative amidohydrolase [Croceitalea dokdonensis DOKDO 023]|uniref:Putative amidohydrolase n=2 Tax=Croceitalea TaxID=574891 RepID=A0A0P7A588_9FLAO|nr:Putative amidohydrolase [Croceitalea dokdonensis DOKDO 023]